MRQTQVLCELMDNFICHPALTQPFLKTLITHASCALAYFSSIMNALHEKPHYISFE